ncbi:hypothetical protein D062_10611 [Streptococcus pneumoniae 1542]|nr:hypothetical protein D059_10327 [Streptococcus pneumoniae 801]EOB24476.1 hypothetical protein D062_10611 [Streptococcus pneumoniae 1542]
MRHKFQQVLNKIHDFLNGYDQPDQTETNSLTATIEEAIQKQTAVHLILSETSFTGDIIKYDQQGQQIIVKIFQKCEPDYPYKRYSTPAICPLNCPNSPKK